MRIIADENIPGEAVLILREKGHDVVWARTDMPGSSDRQVLERAQSEGRILLTFDKDFGELAFRFHLPATCGIVLFRISTPSPSSVTKKIEEAISSRTDWAGH